MAARHGALSARTRNMRFAARLLHLSAAAARREYGIFMGLQYYGPPLSDETYERVARETATKPASWSQKAATLVSTRSSVTGFILLGYSVSLLFPFCTVPFSGVSAVTRAYALECSTVLS